MEEEIMDRWRREHGIIKILEISGYLEGISECDRDGFCLIFNRVFFYMSDPKEECSVREEAMRFILNHSVIRRLRMLQVRKVMAFLEKNIWDDDWTERILSNAVEILKQGAYSTGIPSSLSNFLYGLLVMVEKNKECFWWQYAKVRRESVEAFLMGIKDDSEKLTIPFEDRRDVLVGDGDADGERSN
jgi:hypothetical protein